MLAKLENLSDLRARINWLIVAAPDRFPKSETFGSDHRKNLEIVFQHINESFFLVERKVSDKGDREKLKGLLRGAHLAYENGDRKGAIRLLQDFQGLLFPNQFKEFEERKGSG